jgi:hypothetical protein
MSNKKLRIELHRTPILTRNIFGMETKYASCPHCGTVNFESRKTCSSCHFLLPLQFGARSKSRPFRTYFLIIALVVIGCLFLLLYGFW